MKLVLLSALTLFHSQQTFAQQVAAQLPACCAGKTTGPKVTKMFPGPGNGVQIETSAWTTFKAKVTDSCGVASVNFEVNAHQHPPTKTSASCETGYYCLDYTFPDDDDLRWSVQASDVCGNFMETNKLTFHGPDGATVKQDGSKSVEIVKTPKQQCCVGKTTGPSITKMYPGPGNQVKINTSGWTTFQAKVSDNCGVADVSFIIMAHQKPQSKISSSCPAGYWCKDYMFPDDRDLKWHVEALDICGNTKKSNQLTFHGPKGPGGPGGMRHLRE